MKPEVGKTYHASGFTFRVDFIENGEVYFVRWRGDEEEGTGLRIPLDEWSAEELEGKIPVLEPDLGGEG